MVSFVSENVAAEKVDAMRRFGRRRYFWKFLPAVEALVVVLMLLSWLRPPLAVGEYLRGIITGGLTGGIFIFGLVNVLIALIFSLSNDHKKVIEPDLYVQYVSSSTTAPLGGCSFTASSVGLSSSSAVVSESLASDNEKKTSDGKSGTDFTSVTRALTIGEARPMRREMVRAVSSVAETSHADAIRRKSSITTDHQVYRRSRSERLGLRGDSRRSMRRLCNIDDLSSDEFRSTVETFIAGKKKMLFKEWMKP